MSTDSDREERDSVLAWLFDATLVELRLQWRKLAPQFIGSSPWKNGCQIAKNKRPATQFDGLAKQTRTHWQSAASGLPSRFAPRNDGQMDWSNPKIL